MPKALPSNEICRTDTKKQTPSSSSSGGGGSNPTSSSSTVASKKSASISKPLDRLAKAKLASKGKVLKRTPSPPPPQPALATTTDHEKKVKTKKSSSAVQLPLKTRSGKKETVNAGCKAKMKEKSKLKTKEEAKSKVKPKEPKKTATAGVAKKETGRKPAKLELKAASAESKAEVNETHSAATIPLPPKKELKKRKELSDAVAEGKKASKVLKKDETVPEALTAAAAGTASSTSAPKKESQKCLEKEAKVTRITEMDEKCMAPKKRLKQKCANEAAIAAAHLKKESAAAAAEAKEAVKPPAQPKNIKFFKSKSKKAEKPKETPPASAAKANDALSVYDKLDEDSDECVGKPLKSRNPTTQTKNKVTKAETKGKPQPEESKKSKPKSKSAAEKRKLDSDSEDETAGGKAKKPKLESVATKPAKTKKSTPKGEPSKKDEGSTAWSSDDAPLNKLVPSKKAKPSASKKVVVKQEPNSEDSEEDVKLATKSKAKATTAAGAKLKGKSKLAAQAKKTNKASKETKSGAKNKKSVRFSKSVASETEEAIPAKPVPKRRQRMASLNALAMVHCMYENEGKSVSISSFESTEVSDDNFRAPKKSQQAEAAKQAPVVVKEELKEAAVVKVGPQSDLPESVINRECLRSGAGVRSIGKHWEMNGSSISSDVDQEVMATVQPVVIEEMEVLEKPKNALRKKFGRALWRHVSEDSSEEDKHQALLLEEKQRMMRRRRRQRKEITMDLKDMVVCKRMASLNATAILAASYSSTTGKKTSPVKTASNEEKRENMPNFKNTESLINKMKGRKFPFIKKKFSSSSDADVEDEADVSGSEVVVKTTASSSGKQQVSLIVNQDSGVTITGLYLNSTTKSTHRQGFCSISGMQYRISSTSHTQTEATTVSTEPIVRTQQDPLRPPITVSLHGDRQASPPSRPAMPTAHPSPVKTYTPLGALSNMQPPGSPHHVHHLHHHPKTVTIATQEISSLERHGCPSAFSAPTLYGPPAPPPTLATVATRSPYPILSKTPPEAGFVAGYYQPAGPLISHHHHHHHHHHHVQQPANSTMTTSSAGGGGATASAGSASASASASAGSFTKVSHQSPLVQPPTPPASNVTQPVSEASDNEMASATTPAAEIAVSENVPEDASYVNYRFAAAATAAAHPPPFRSPSQHAYQNYYPSPPSTASLSHPQQQQHQPPPPPPQPAHFQEVLYSANPQPPPPGPPTAYHLGYLQPKVGPSAYHPPLHRRYIPALPPHQQYYHHEYPASAPGSQQQIVVPVHHPLTSTADAYHHPAPPTPSLIESYPPPPPPPPLYYSGYSPAPPAPYYPYATSSRSLTLVETSCPCPLQGCQKNGHTGPLTGIISKGPVKQRNTPLSPVALTLPKEPQDIRSLPSPARGSAGSRPTPSPAIATAKHPSSWNEGSDNGYDTAGLLTISKLGQHESMADIDSGIDGSAETSPAKIKRSKCDRHHETKKSKMRKFKARRSAKEACRGDDELTKIHSTFCGQAAAATLDAAGMLSVTPLTEFVAHVRGAVSPEVETNTDVCDSMEEEQMDELTPEGVCDKRWSGDDSSEPEMPKLYPEVSPPPPQCKRANRLFLDDDDDDDDDDELLLAKRAKLGCDDSGSGSSSDATSLVDVEKNNYLSALELCSVSNVVDQRLDAKQPAEDLAPLHRCDEPPVKIAGKSRPQNSSAEQLPADTPEVETGGANVPWSSGGQDCVGGTSTAACRGLSTHVESKKPRFRRRRWTTSKKKKKKKSRKSSRGGTEEEKQEAENAERRRRAELLSLSQKRAANRLKWSNGWNWLGEPFVSKVFLNTEGAEVLRTCYPAMKHQSGDVIRPKDCILLRSGCKKTDLPYIAKVAHLWEDPEDGEMMMSLFWYYRPEHTEQDSIHSESPYELYASKHKDVNSVACIEDKCYVLTFNEYCRYHKSIRQAEESVDVCSVIVPPLAKKRYPRQALLPPENTSLDLVFFCRKIYDFRQHRLLKNPFFV